MSRIRISGSSSGAHYKNSLRQTEGWRVPESGSARCQSLQPPVSRLNHIPGTQQIPNSCIIIVVVQWPYHMQLRQEGRQTLKSCLRFNYQTVRGQHEKFTSKTTGWMSRFGLFFRRHFCISGRRHPTRWQPSMRASRAVSIMSSPHWRSESMLTCTDGIFTAQRSSDTVVFSDLTGADGQAD